MLVRTKARLDEENLAAKVKVRYKYSDNQNSKAQQL